MNQNREPLVAGPNDKVKKPEESSKETASTPNTLTDRLAQKFAAQYLSAIGSSQGNIDAFQKNAIAESLIESMAGSALTLKDAFSSSDIQVDNAATTTELKKIYLNAAGEVLEKNFEGLEESEVDILNRALDSTNFDELKKMDAYIMAYKKTIEFLKKQKVPSSYAILHMEVMNILNNTNTAVVYMRNAEKDPAQALAGLSIYTKTAERGSGYLENIQKQIQRDKIEFSASEGGYHFMHPNQ